MYTCFDNLDSFLQIELQSLTHPPNKSALSNSGKRTSLYSAASSKPKTNVTIRCSSNVSSNYSMESDLSIN